MTFFFAKVDFGGGKQIILFFKKKHLFLRSPPLNSDFLIFLKKMGKKDIRTPIFFTQNSCFFLLHRRKTGKKVWSKKSAFFFVYRPYIRWSTRNWPPCIFLAWGPECKAVTNFLPKTAKKNVPFSPLVALKCVWGTCHTALIFFCQQP